MLIKTATPPIPAKNFFGVYEADAVDKLIVFSKQAAQEIAYLRKERVALGKPGKPAKEAPATGSKQVKMINIKPGSNWLATNYQEPVKSNNDYPSPSM